MDMFTPSHNHRAGVDAGFTLLLAAIPAALAWLSLATFTASAHPSSGIVVDQQGDVFFSDLDRGVLKIDAQGKVTTIFSKEGGHWLALGGNKGLAVGPKGSLYASYPSAVLKFGLDGKVTTLLNPVVVADCDKDPTSSDSGPSLRGLAVDARGTVYVAATGCRRVIKITA